MSTYQPAEGVYVGRPPCATCGANIHLHSLPPELARRGTVDADRYRITSQGLQRLLDAGAQLTCPEAYRPGSMEEAERGLAAAEAAGDPARVFIARGHLQQLQGRRQA